MFSKIAPFAAGYHISRLLTSSFNNVNGSLICVEVNK